MWASNIVTCLSFISCKSCCSLWQWTLSLRSLTSFGVSSSRLYLWFDSPQIVVNLSFRLPSSSDYFLRFFIVVSVCLAYDWICGMGNRCYLRCLRHAKYGLSNTRLDRRVLFGLIVGFEMIWTISRDRCWINTRDSAASCDSSWQSAGRCLDSIRSWSCAHTAGDLGRWLPRSSSNLSPISY